MYFGSGDIQECDGLAWRSVHYEKKNISTINRAFDRDENGKVHYGPAYGDFSYLRNIKMVLHMLYRCCTCCLEMAGK
jgi:hypothetical protein